MDFTGVKIELFGMQLVYIENVCNCDNLKSFLAVYVYLLVVIKDNWGSSKY